MGTTGTTSTGFVQLRSTSNFANNSEFLDFQFGDFIGSNYGLIRTSNGDRYELNLTPEMQDFTIDIPNNDGQYYYGTSYQARKITVPFAFDNLTEMQLKNIRQKLNLNKIQKLYLSETADRFYYAKLTDSCQIKHLCFEQNGQRIYKGDGSFTFTCYYPFSQSEMYTLTRQNMTSIDTNASVDSQSSYVAVDSDEDILDGFTTNNADYDDDSARTPVNTIMQLEDLLIFWDETETSSASTTGANQNASGNTTIYLINSGDLPMPIVMNFSNFLTKAREDENDPIEYEQGELSVKYLGTESVIRLSVNASNPIFSVLQGLYAGGTEIASILFDKGTFSSLKFDNREQWVLGLNASGGSTLANECMVSGSFFELLPQCAYALNINKMTLDSVEFCYVYK